MLQLKEIVKDYRTGDEVVKGEHESFPWKQLERKIFLIAEIFLSLFNINIDILAQKCSFNVFNELALLNTVWVFVLFNEANVFSKAGKIESILTFTTLHHRQDSSPSRLTDRDLSKSAISACYTYTPALQTDCPFHILYQQQKPPCR